MIVVVNGNQTEQPNGITVRQLLAQSNLTPERVAIELNKRLVRSEKYDAPLNDGDVIEIVTFVGGG